MHHRHRLRLATVAILASPFVLASPCAWGAETTRRQADGAAVGQAVPYRTVPYDKVSPEKMKWWEDAKFGLFVHWGVYSVPGGIWSKDNTFKGRFDGNADNQVEVKGYAEQILKATGMPLGEYEKIAGIFDWSKFNAQDYINLCFASGQRYIVITSKHHDGFATWRSKVSPWNIGDATPYGRQSGRDPLKELADACRATKTNGSPWEIKLCFYHSHCADWWEEDGVAFGYAPHQDPDVQTFQRYLDRKVKPQLTELLTNYGEIGMIWFDVPRVLSIDQAQQLKDLVHKLSPNTLIDGRLGHDMGNYSNTGDNGVVGVPVDVPWETGSSINESYGYKINAQEYKTPEEIIGKLIQVVSHGGNYLLNIGPKGDGTIPDKDRDILTEVGKWTRPNAEAIFGTRRTPYFGDQSFMPEWGTCTEKGGNLYLFVTRWPKEGKIVVPLLQNEIKRVSFLADAGRKPLPCTRSKDNKGNDTVVISVPEAPLHKVATVIAVECEGGSLKFAPFKHAYDPAKKQIYLDAANFAAYAQSVKSLSLYYDREQKAIVNWRYGKGGGPAVVWSCEVPEPGEYVVEVDYALDKRHAGLPINVLVDHKKQLTFETQATGGENVCKQVPVGTVRLEKGKQDIALDLVKTGENKLFVMQMLRGVYLTRK
jgi:alpha-L-fucosidase